MVQGIVARNYVPVWIGERAEGDGIIGVVAGEGRSGIIISITIRLWASRLEELGVLRGVAGVGVAVGAIAAELGLAERLAGAAARPAARPAGAELGGAAVVEVDEAARVRAVRRRGPDEHGQVVAVDEAHVVEVLPSVAVQGELGEGCRWGRPRAVALRRVCAAVARGAGGAAAAGFGGEVAAGARPEAAGPARGRVEGAGLAWG